MNIPDHESISHVPQSERADYCIKHGFNAHALITGTGELTLSRNRQHLWCLRTALALNAVMLTCFTDLNQFYKTFRLDAQTINMLWTGAIVPRRSLVHHLTQIYDVNLVYIFRPEVKAAPIFTTDLERV